MAFKKIDVHKLPARQWLLIGFPDSGKSSFATQMKGPILCIDADQRAEEVASLTDSDIYHLSNDPADNINPEKISLLLRANMTGSGIKTIVVDSLTSIITPLVVQAVMDNDAGKNKNRMSAFKGKSLALRLIQDNITGYGVDTLWIAHVRSGMDSNAKQIESTSISPVELARLRRSLNMELRVVQDGNKRGIRVDWARRGRSGMTLWDETGKWTGMCERIETAVYGGLTVEDQERIEGQTPTAFASPAAAIAWGYEQGCFNDAVHASHAYDKCKAEKKPTTAQAMWTAWIADVTSRMAEAEAEEASSGEPMFDAEVFA